MVCSRLTLRLAGSVLALIAAWVPARAAVPGPDDLVTTGVAGRVSDATTGSPIPGALVRLFDSAGNGISDSYSDPTGEWSITGDFPSGAYFVRTMNLSELDYPDELFDDIYCELYCDIITGTPITVVAGAVTSNINFLVDGSGTITGTITSARTGLPVPDSGVDVYDQTGQLVGGADADASGAWVVSGTLRAGPKFVVAKAREGYLKELYEGYDCSPRCDVISGTPVSVQSGATTTGVDIALDLSGSITGTVSDSATGLPIDGANISIVSEQFKTIEIVRSDASGVWRWASDLPTGSYYAKTFFNDGYYDELYDDVDCSDNKCHLEGGTLIAVVAGLTTSGIDFELEPGGVITGRLTDIVTGQTIADARVELYDSSGAWIAATRPNEEGVWTISKKLPPGLYFALLVDADWYSNMLFDAIDCAFGCDVTNGTPISLVPPETVAGIDFTLKPAGAIAGSLTDATQGNLIEGRVGVYDDHGNQLLNLPTNGGSWSTVSNVPVGTYFVRTIGVVGFEDQLYDGIDCSAGCDVTAGTPVAVTGGTVSSDVDFELELTPMIAGKVVDAATGLAIGGIRVRIFNESGNFVVDAFSTEDGSWATVNGLEPGVYRALAYGAANHFTMLYDAIDCRGGCTASDGTPIVVSAGSVTSNIDFALEPCGVIAGSVTAAADGSPISGAGVTIYDEAGVELGTAYTFSDGSWYRSGLDTGSYYARVPYYPGFIDELYDNVHCPTDCDVSLGTPITVVAGSWTSGIDIALDTPGAVSGTVTDAVSGLPIAGARVYLYDSFGEYVRNAATDADGQWVVSSGLSPGSYFARTRDVEGHLDELFDDLACWSGCAVTAGTPITVDVGVAVSGVDFVLLPTGTIEGRVTDSATGLPINGALVVIYDQVGNSLGSAHSDVSGQWSYSSSLAPGSYFVGLPEVAGYIGEVFDGLQCLGSCDVTAGTPVAVHAGSVSSGVDFALDRSEVISGLVSDSVTALPLEHVAILVYDHMRHLVTFGLSEANGTWTAQTNLVAGTYFARTYYSPGGYVEELYDDIPWDPMSLETSGTPIVVTAGEPAGNVDFSLDPLATLAGSVSDASTGLPVAGAEVRVYGESGSVVGTVTSGSAGSWELSNVVGPGTYFARTYRTEGYFDELFDDMPCPWDCDVKAGTPIVASAGATISNIDFALNPPGSITGVVADASTGNPISGVQVSLYDELRNPVGSGLSDSNGVWAVSWLRPGADCYAETSEVPGYLGELFDNVDCSSGCSLGSGTRIAAAPGVTTSGVDFLLDPSGVIAGQVLDAADGSPIEGARVEIYDQGGQLRAATTSGGEGAWSANANLPSNTYYAAARDVSGYFDELYQEIECPPGGDVTSGTPISVVAGETSLSVDFSLTASGRVAGTVRDALGGAPIAGALVRLYRESGEHVVGKYTDSNGGWEISSNLSSGTYFARTDGVLGYVDQLYDDLECSSECVVTAGTPIEVTVGDGTTNVDFALRPSAAIFWDGFEDGSAMRWSTSVGMQYEYETLRVVLPGNVPMDFVHIPGGSFLMGSPTDERGRSSNEDLHEVHLTNGYYLGQYEVTQAQWMALMGSNPAHDYGLGDDHPVYYVSWDDVCGGSTGDDCTAESFIGRLNSYVGGQLFRLPTEAEWERAARGGVGTEFSFAAPADWDTDCGTFDAADDYMVWCGNSGGSTSVVGAKAANPFGLFDMHGNLWEWVADYYAPSLGGEQVTDPSGPVTGSYRVKRGGQWNYHATACRSASRGYNVSSVRDSGIGFRVARSE